MPQPLWPVDTLLTDSRSLSYSPRALFFALPGTHHDGHAFVEELYAKGVRCFVIQAEAALRPEAYPEANFCQVPRVVEALQQLAAFHRRGFDYPVVGITGSNGKTIVKEWLTQLLSPEYRIVSSPKSYNSQIGVPLAVWHMAADHQLGIFEAGISQPREMERLAQVLHPTLGIFTNIGSAHDEGFASRQEKIAEKWKLFADCPVVICARQHEAVYAYLMAHRSPDQHIVAWHPDDFSFPFPFADEASLENARHCAAMLRWLRYDDEAIAQRLQHLLHVPMRLEFKEGINRCSLIDDSYNNDLVGLRIALEFMRQQKNAVNLSRTVILSDILQTHSPEEESYGAVVDLLHQAKIARFIGIGTALLHHQQLFASIPQTHFFATTEQFLDAYKNSDFQDAIILVKGARAFRFERIVQRLQLQAHGTRLEINLDALVHNLNMYRHQLRPGVKMMVMVKALAYGSGSAEIASLLQYHGVDYLGVAYADEGVALREQGIRLPIMVMNPSASTFEKMALFQLEPEVYSFGQLKELSAYAQATQQPFRIHLKIDTGMRRLGFEPTEVPALLQQLAQVPQLTVASVFSHLAGADESQHDTFTQNQMSYFADVVSLMEKALPKRPLFHLLNSAGIARFPEAQWDMVRLGIGLYGTAPSTEASLILQPIGVLKTTVSQVKTIQPGETVGYGRRGKADQKKRIATLAIGYADGYSRAFSNGVGWVLIRGQKAPVIGNVCMDMTMVDVTSIGEVQEGEEAIVFGEGLAVETLAHQIHTIPYELLTRVSERVKRVFYSA